MRGEAELHRGVAGRLRVAESACRAALVGLQIAEDTAGACGRADLATARRALGRARAQLIARARRQRRSCPPIARHR